MPPDNVLPIRRGGGVQPISGAGAAITSGSATFSQDPGKSEAKEEVTSSSDGVSRHELNATVAASEARSQALVAELRSAIDSMSSGLRADMAGLKAEVAVSRSDGKVDVERLRADTAERSSAQTKWLLAALAVFAPVVGAISGFISKSDHTAQQASPQLVLMQPYAPAQLTIPAPPSASAAQHR